LAQACLAAARCELQVLSASTLRLPVMAGTGRMLRGEEVLPLNSERYAIAISWDKGRKPVDVDLQAVVVNDQGAIIDAVYYNNLKALRCITHSGDEVTGERQGFDEIVWVGLSRLPAHVQMLIFVVAAHSGGHLRDVANGMIHVLEERKDNEVARFAMEQSPQDVDVVAAMVRFAGGNWGLRVIDEPAQSGQHFIDILEPTIGNLIRKVIPTAPKRQKVAFAMEKGAVFDLPQSSQIQRITACLGWDVEGEGVDLDVSAVLFDSSGRNTEAIFFGNLEGEGIKHSGDNLTGAGEGDDERIVCNLDQISSRVQEIFFVVNIYTPRVTFQRVSNAFCRIVDSSETELARYALREGGSESGLLMARLFRESDGRRWSFQAIGTFCRGRTWKDSVNDIIPLVCKDPRTLQLRGQSTMQFSGAGEHDGPRSAQTEDFAVPKAQAPRRQRTRTDTDTCTVQ